MSTAVRTRRSAVVLTMSVLLVLTGGAWGAHLLWRDATTADAGGTVTCWDGTTSARAGQCSLPTGAEGLRWVFPSLDPERCEERRGGPTPRWECRADVEGERVLVRYGAVGSVEGGATFFDRTYGQKRRTPVRAEDGGEVERWLWRSARPRKGVHTLTTLYADVPYFVTVEAPTAEARDQALSELVELRPGGQLRGARD